MKLTLTETLQAVSGAAWPVAGGAASVLLTSAVIDSRLAGPGSLFVALPGEHSDGHAYVSHAFQPRRGRRPWSAGR